jgi:Lon-like ATP-dependent protease
MRVRGHNYVGTFLVKDAAAQAASPDAEAAGDAANAPRPSVDPQAEADPDAAAAAAALADVELMHEHGTLAQVHNVIKTGDSGAMLMLMGHRRLRRTGVMRRSPLVVQVKHLKDDRYDASDDVLKATSNEVLSTIKELLLHNPLHKESVNYFAQHTNDVSEPAKLADLAASLCSADGAALQRLLETSSVLDRLQAALLLLKKEVELSRLQADIGKRVEEKITADQRRYFLNEQLKRIKKELGLEKDDKSALAARFSARLAALGAGVPPEARRVIEEELGKLSALEPASSEFNVTRAYLDWLTALPWGVHQPETLDIGAAQAVLDADHYGLEDVKERILEFIAVARLRGSTQGKILCLVGPPGVGKTSIGKSIAHALNRKFYRFSVGGLSDVAEIKGHRRTYVGAMPGKAVQCLKATGVANPLVLIDEIDKLGRGGGYGGDPASALLELLDPEQNGTFTDHYLDVPTDLSKVLFVCTANVLDTIPGPLLDRMEVIRLSGYMSAEKVAIARRYLEPGAREASGVGASEAVRLTDGAVSSLVNDYAREAGVRNLQKQLEKVFRKVALAMVRGAAAAEGGGGPEGTPAPPSEASPLVIDAPQLTSYLGPPPFPTDKLYADATPVGVVTGLAWTAMGGSTLYVECGVSERSPGKGGLRATGQLGDVMRESADIAHTYAKAFLRRLRPGDTFFTDAALHVHVPAGAVPKDGPSAGATLVTALLSAALGRPAAAATAMTGEVTLTGRVLPVGGIKEKTIAARRAGVRTLILPAANARDFEELPAEVREGIAVHFVERYEQVYDLTLARDGDPPRAPAPEDSAA